MVRLLGSTNSLSGLDWDIGYAVLIVNGMWKIGKTYRFAKHEFYSQEHWFITRALAEKYLKWRLTAR